MIKIITLIYMLISIIGGGSNINTKEQNIQTQNNTLLCTQKQITYKKYGSTLQIQYAQTCKESKKKNKKTRSIAKITTTKEGPICNEICDNLWPKDTNEKNNCKTNCISE